MKVVLPLHDMMRRSTVLSGQQSTGATHPPWGPFFFLTFSLWFSI